MLLTALVLSGVFERHPKLTFLLAELGIDWLATLAADLDARVAQRSPIGAGYALPLPPSESIRPLLAVMALSP